MCPLLGRNKQSFAWVLGWVQGLERVMTSKQQPQQTKRLAQSLYNQGEFGGKFEQSTCGTFSIAALVHFISWKWGTIESPLSDISEIHCGGSRPEQQVPSYLIIWITCRPVCYWKQCGSKKTEKNYLISSYCWTDTCFSSHPNETRRGKSIL